MHLPLVANIIFWTACIVIAIPKNKAMRRIAMGMAFAWLVVNILNDYFVVRDYASGNSLVVATSVIVAIEAQKFWKRKKQASHE